MGLERERLKKDGQRKSHGRVMSMKQEGDVVASQEYPGNKCSIRWESRYKGSEGVVCHGCLRKSGMGTIARVKCMWDAHGKEKALQLLLGTRLCGALQARLRCWPTGIGNGETGNHCMMMN